MQEPPLPLLTQKCKAPVLTQVVTTLAVCLLSVLIYVMATTHLMTTRRLLIIIWSILPVLVVYGVIYPFGLFSRKSPEAVEG